MAPYNDTPPKSRFCWVALGITALVLSACSSGSSVSSGPTDPTDPTDPTGDSGQNTGGTEPPEQTLSSPNILLIIADDQGLDSSAQYDLGQDLPNTPVINALADRGIVFDNAWGTPSCTTSRGSIISGQHGINSGVTTTPSLLDPNTLTMQRYLSTTSSSVNYATAVVGKWHLAGGNPNNELTHPNDSGVDYYAGNIAGTLDDYSLWPLTTNGVTTESSVYHTTAVTDLAIDWIEEQQNPWFMWLAYVAPHSPFHLPPENLHNRTLSGSAADINANPRNYYLAAIEAMDTEIGRLLNTLPPATIDNTVIIYIGDNGTPRAVVDASVYNNTQVKSTLYEGGIRIPMVVAGAGVDRSNERESALINTVDIFPTVAQAAGLSAPQGLDGQSFWELLSNTNAASRQYNYSEFVGDRANGWTVRDGNLKLIVFQDGSRELYNLDNDQMENNNLITQTSIYGESMVALEAFGLSVRGQTARPGEPAGQPAIVDITGAILVNQSANCADYVNTYQATANDVINNSVHLAELEITTDGQSCTFSPNAIPNHDFNDGDRGFPNPVSEQDDQFTVSASPTIAAQTTPLSLTVDNAIMLNGVRVDILSAGCFGVGDGRIGCNDPDQPWRFDPMHPAAGFLVDSHNAHTQPDGTYHYHGEPKALFSADGITVSPVVGFAADGFPVFGSYINDNGNVRAVNSSYRLKSGARPSGNGQPGGDYDGSFRDDYEYVNGLGDLDECNGMSVNGLYQYHITESFPYVLGCFKGTPDTSFSKGGG